ncbi:Predicted arabinose efflux permease, MFS family [Krasilnikoviella flava]|uniref:Predicted arabinose efflux permease, MFS family n=1 Tax=Krasilnikoviella flava TaxID=526729 RepID=A0A1T5I7J3_9MICO|nr:Predicted arabinose efflux permease, MFS family [Krasilnikoviella flava]
MRRLWAAVALGYLSLGVGLQLLPHDLAQRGGTPEPLVPVLVGLPFLASAWVRPRAGRLADRGLARGAVAAGAVAVAVGAAGQAATVNPGSVAIARLLVGLGEGLLFSGALPWVLAAAPAARRGRVAGWFGLSMWTGLTVGPAAAVLTAGLGAAGTTLAWVLAVAAPLTALGLVASAGRQAEVRSRDASPAPSDPPTGRRRRRWGRRSSAERLPGIYLGLVACGYGVVISMLALYLRSRGLPDTAGLTVLAAAFLVVRAAGSPAVDRWGPARPAAVLAVVQGVALAVLPTVTGVPGALVVCAAVGAGVALAYPCAVALTLGTPSARPPGVAIGVTTSCWDLGLFAAGLGAGALSLAAGQAAPFFAGAMASAGAAAVLLPAAVTAMRGRGADGDARTPRRQRGGRG